MFIFKNTRPIFLIKILILCLVFVFAISQITNIFVDVNYNAIPHFLMTKLGPEREVQTSDLYQLATLNFTSSTLRGYPRILCACEAQLRKDPEKHKSLLPNESSTCSNEATEFGMGQKVISYSLYMDDPKSVPFFLEGIQPNLDLVTRIFPGWLVRIYTDIPPNKYSCAFICKYEFLFWCNIKDIPKLGDMSGVNGRIWRFLPIGDPSVDIVLSRDLDSTLSIREREAVAEWEASSQKLHVMRDSQWHDTEILAGMWGLKNMGFKPEFTQDLRDTIMKVGVKNETKFWDQYISKTYLYVPMKSEVLAHDSFYCTKYTGTVIRPFPSQRKGNEFVGNDERKEMVNFILRRLDPCPRDCRPAKGQNWTYC